MAPQPKTAKYKGDPPATPQPLPEGRSPFGEKPICGYSHGSRHEPTDGVDVNTEE